MVLYSVFKGGLYYIVYLRAFREFLMHFKGVLVILVHFNRFPTLAHTTASPRALSSGTVVEEGLAEAHPPPQAPGIAVDGRGERRLGESVHLVHFKGVLIILNVF